MEKQKRNDAIEVADVSTKKMRMELNVKPLLLNDLNDDCLVEIFKHFSIEDLINIVDMIHALKMPLALFAV